MADNNDITKKLTVVEQVFMKNSRQGTFLYEISIYSFVICSDITEEVEIKQKENKLRPET